MVWAGGSASRTINDSDTPGPGHAIPDRASVVVEQNSNLDPLWHSERDGSHRAPLGHNVRAAVSMFILVCRSLAEVMTSVAARGLCWRGLVNRGHKGKICSVS